MTRAYYARPIAEFLETPDELVIGLLTTNSEFSVEQTQCDAWMQQIALLRKQLPGLSGTIFMEYAIPRMGKRVDVVLLVNSIVFVVEFKVGASSYRSADLRQVTDYALDLKNFHETSHNCSVVPVLLATKAPESGFKLQETAHNDGLAVAISSNGDNLRQIVDRAPSLFSIQEELCPAGWSSGRYLPTPTIIEAATALYNGHAVAEISRSDAGGAELQHTSDTIESIVRTAKLQSHKAICFVTGVPGAGKTLIGLNIATRNLSDSDGQYSVFLSGNGPLVKILQEALARDRVARERASDKRIRKSDALSEVKLFIQNVHHYRDEYLRDKRPPVDQVAIFDEAQRAWNLEQTSKFMQRKKNQPNFNQSEPEFLISCIDRHDDWGVIVCLVGGGQEINTGEGGISEWIGALNRSFPHWHVHVSDRLTDSEYGSGAAIEALTSRKNVIFDSRLHLGVSMRSFRAENVSRFVKEILDLDSQAARTTLHSLNADYPIFLTRSLDKAKSWLRRQARGSERYGIIVSSQANRLKPLAIDVRLQPNPVHWFLADNDDVRSSYYLEDVATEFDIQGLELDWTCVTWDADLRYSDAGWRYRSFRGKRWQQIRNVERQSYLKNAYRVLLTRARQGMVIVVPYGDESDPTRQPAFYDGTYGYLESLGLQILG